MASTISGLSSSRTETKTVPSRGTLLPAPICDLGEGDGVVGVEADDLAGRLHLGAEHGVDAGEAVEGEHGFLDRDVLDVLRSTRLKLARVSPAMMRRAILANGLPMTLATKGTVREARGLTSRM